LKIYAEVTVDIIEKTLT